MLKGLIGVIHLPAMPGDPLHNHEAGFSAVRQHALRDAEAFVAGGVRALIIENFGSTPFPKGDAGSRLPPHQVATLALVAGACVERFDVPVGLNCLRNDAISAIGIAAATNAAFVRVNVHTGAYVTDQGLIEGEAYHSVRYRSSLAADNVRILADVQVKHAHPLVPIDTTAAVHDTLHRGAADGIVITGEATGRAVSAHRLEEARRAAGEAPVYIGSGLTPDNAKTLAPLCDGAIVGTWVKKEARVHAPVDVERVRQLVDTAANLFR